MCLEGINENLYVFAILKSLISAQVSGSTSEGSASTTMYEPKVISSDL
jgi:hypothetical protein